MGQIDYLYAQLGHILLGFLPAGISFPVIPDKEPVIVQHFPALSLVQAVNPHYFIHIFDLPDNLHALPQGHNGFFILVALHQLIGVHSYDEVITASGSILQQVQMADMKHVEDTGSKSYDFILHLKPLPPL